MRTLLLRAAAVAALSVPAAGIAAPGAQTEAEIAHLRDYLSASNCEFYRNGSWHAAADARKHIDRKYAWLRKREMADTAELFIERAASRSERSGKPYRVRCQGTELEASRWLREELARFRAG